MDSIVIGLDIGTTSIKAVAFHQNGIVHNEYEVAYPLHTPQPSWAEQDPLLIETAAMTVIRHVVSHIQDKEKIVAIGLSSAMHSLICINSKGEALSPLITWADGRATTQAKKIKEQFPNLYEATGTPIHPMAPLVKLLWMKETNFQPYQQADKFVSIKEFLLYRWFGAQFVDYSIAAATGLFDIHTLQWNQQTLQLADITEAQLFTPVPPTTKIIGLKSEVASQLGLPMDIPFVIGASDGVLANLGIGAITPGEVAITIGTSGAIRQLVNKPQIDQQHETFCYTFTDSLSLIGGPTNNGGIVLNWLKEMFGNRVSYDNMTESAKLVPAGAEGLLFLPYLNGERAPMWNSQMKGNIFGLTVRHQKEHIIRAGMEGVILSIYHVGQALERLAGPPKKIYASGGFARSPLWLQILADVFNQEVQVPISHQSSAWGAAWIALHSIGLADDITEIKKHIPMKGQYIPNEENHQIYMEMFSLYRRLSKSMNDYFSSEG